jgi:anti-sigma regulatory factor (Ser/Thr protein kinase)
MGIDLQITLDADDRAPGRARRGVVGACDPRMSRGRREDLVLVVSELVSNSVMHAGIGPSGAILLAVDCTHERIRVEVQDDGPGLEGVPGGGDVGRGGRGLRIVERLGGRWGSHGSFPATVWAELPLH